MAGIEGPSTQVVAFLDDDDLARPWRDAVTRLAVRGVGRPDSGGGTMSEQRFDTVGLAAEVALGLVTLSIALGFSRLFASTEFIPGLVVNVVAAHAVMAFVRRRGWPPAAVLAVIVAAVLVIAGSG